MYYICVRLCRYVCMCGVVFMCVYASVCELMSVCGVQRSTLSACLYLGKGLWFPIGLLIHEAPGMLLPLFLSPL